MTSDTQLLDFLERTRMLRDTRFRVYKTTDNSKWVLADQYGPIYYKDTLREALTFAVGRGRQSAERK